MKIRSLLLFSCVVLAACDGSGAADAGKPAPNFDPSPANATRIDLGTPLGADRILLATVEFANFERHGGQLFLFVSGSVFEQQLICSDFGCINVWGFAPVTFCWKVDGAVASVSTACQQRADLRTFQPPVEEQGALFSAMRTFSGSRRPTTSFLGGVLLSGSPDAGTYELLGSAKLEVPALEEFSSWVQADVMRASPVHYRLSIRDGLLTAPPLLQRSPDEVPLMDGLMAFVDEGTLELQWRNRDDTSFAVDSSAPALTGKRLGNGVFGLGWDAPFFPSGAHTAGAAVVDSQWLGLFVTPSYESTDDHGEAQGGGPLLNLWLRRANIEGESSLPLTHFTGLEATTASAQTVDVCFNRRLDPASVSTASISIEGLEVKSFSLLPGEQCLVLHTAQQSRSQSYAVHVAGLRSVEGEALVGSGQRLSFLPDEAAVTDLLGAFTGVKPGSLDGFDSVLLPLKTGAVLVHSEGHPFQEGSGWFLTGVDARSLINLSERYLAQGYTVERVIPSSSFGGAWLSFQQRKPGLVFLDGEREVIFTAENHPGMIFDLPTVLGDGTALVKQGDGSFLNLLADGTITSYLPGGPRPSVSGVVMGSTDVLLPGSAAMVAERVDADGGVQATFDFNGLSSFLPVSMVLFELGGEQLICAPSSGLYRVEPSPARMTKLLAGCDDAVIAPDGSLWVQPSSFISTDAKEYRYAQGQLTPQVIADPLYGLTKGGWLDRPVRIGDTVFAYAAGRSVGSQDYPSTLRVMTVADFEALRVEDFP